MDIFQLSRNWFDFCFENPEKITTNHSAIYFFAIEHCNRLGWKEKFGFPSQMAMDAIGIKNWRTFIKAFNQLVEWGFIILIEKSKNQYSANVIAIAKNTKANTKALDKALQKHSQKHYKSIVGIDIQETRNKKQETIIEKEKLKKEIPNFDEFKKEALEKKPNVEIAHLEAKYNSWVADGWKDGHGNPIKNWKSKLGNTLPYLKERSPTQQTVYSNEKYKEELKVAGQKLLTEEDFINGRF